MTNKFTLKHYTPHNTSTEELKKMYEGDNFRRKKSIIRRELIKRNAFN